MKTARTLLRYLQGAKSLSALALLSGLVSTSSRLFIPFLAGKAVNVIIANGIGTDLSVYFVLMAIFLTLGLVFGYLFQYLTHYLGQYAIRKMREELFDRYVSIAIPEIDRFESGELLSRLINDIENVQTGLLVGFSTLFEGLIAIIVTMGFMFSINWALALIVVFLTPVSVIVSRFVSNKNSKNFKAQAKSSGFILSFLSEGLQNLETVKAYGLEAEREREFEELNGKNRDDQFKANLGASTINPSTRLVNSLINAVLIAVGAYFLIGNVDLGVMFLIGDLSALLTYASNYMQPFNEVSNVVAEIDYARASLERLSGSLALKDEPETGSKPIDERISSLSAENVDFSYDGQRLVIDSFSFSAEKGERIALVGPTGCGKTTIINLLLRFYDPRSGTFRLNGESIMNLGKRDIRKRIGMVLQESWIFSGTVYENIAYGKPEATLEEVVTAAKRAQAHSFIKRLPNGYDTFLSSKTQLSLGERQLISVARVLLMEPEIIVLDEATSNIDARTESLLGKSFDSLMEGKTSIVVAHRLSTIQNSDLIIVLKDGRVIESGNHESLLRQNGFYRSLYEAQFSAD